MPRKSNKVVDIRHQSGKTINTMELIIFGAITLYILVLIYSYFHSTPISGYEIQMGSLSISKTYTGMALREEEVIQSPYNGYINYFVREGERVSSRDTVYSIDESGKLSTLLNNGELGENTYTDDELSDFRSTIVQFNRIFSQKEFQTVYDFKYDIEGDIMKMVNLNMYQSLGSLNQSSLNGMVNLCTTGKSGYFVYYTDGYEDITPEKLTNTLFDESTYEKTRLNNNELVDTSTAVGKLITSEKWSIAVPMDADYAAELEEEKYVKVKFVRTQESSWASVSVQKNGDDTFVILSFENSCTSFCTERFIEIEIQIDEEKGLKIPLSAIAEKTFFIIPAEYMSKGGENGNYGVSKEFYDENGNVVYEFVETTVYNSNEDEFYVDNENLSVGDYICKPNSTDKMAISKSGSLIGVYNMNKGYADFKQITILYQNDEYAIVSSNTQYGLTVYDRIVLDASSVSTGDFIFN